MLRVIVYCLMLLPPVIPTLKKSKDASVHYLPLGDSYTICTGARENESWPYQLTRHLQENNVSCVLLDNPARNGFSTQDLITHELPLVQTLHPDFVTLLVGVNDWVRKVPKAEFEKNLHYILNILQANLPDQRRILLITIPDFGVTPEGKHYGGGRNITAGISEFNEVIKREASQRRLPVVDVFELSKKMGTDAALVSDDGLHPSAKEYAEWEKRILKESLVLLK